jgi:outer membrane murein-binding lipoprotein Lpp
VTAPYREPGIVETDDAKVARLRREYDCIAIGAQTTPEANARALARMREIARVLDAMGRWT